MAAYMVVDVKVKDAAAYERYKQMTPRSIAPFGGKFIVRGGKTETIEGDWQPGRFVMLEFPSVERAKTWWSSQEYAEAKKLRQSCAETRMILVEGV